MLQLKRIGHILIKTSNIEASLEFYRDVLGFELVEFQSEGHEKMAFLSLGQKGHDIDIIEVPAAELASPERSRFHHMAFEVESYDSLRDAYFDLSDRGIEIIRAMDHVSQKSIYIRDPDGNVVEIYHELPNSIEMFRNGRGDNDAPLVFSR